MLKLNPIGPNQTEVEMDSWVLFFSYKTLVACKDKVTENVFVTSEKYSTTTSRHINKWLDGHIPEYVSQTILEEICNV